MPKTSQDIIAYINYWQAKKSSPGITTWSVKRCDNEILKLEKIMMAGTELAVDLLSFVQNVEIPSQEEQKEQMVTDRSKLPTVDDVRNEIKKIFKEEGEEAARKFGVHMLNKNNIREGTPFVAEAVVQIINKCIEEAQQPIAALPKKTKAPKQVREPNLNKVIDKIPDQQVKKETEEDAWRELKTRFPSLGENITDEECIMIDTYEKAMVESKKARHREEQRIFDIAKQKWLVLDKKTQDEYKEKAIKQYNTLPSEDKATFTEEQFIISYFGDSIGLDPLEPMFEFCKEKETIEEEAIAMKEIQDLTTELLKTDMNKAQAISKFFFGNFKNTTLPIQRGRNWSDAEWAFWFDWVKNGCPDGEWHVYRVRKVKEDQERNVEVEKIKKDSAKKNEIIVSSFDIPEQLKAQLVETIIKDRENEVGANTMVGHLKILYKEHNREWNLKEASELVRYVQHMKKENEPVITEEIVGDSEKVFNRMNVKTYNKELWNKGKNVKDLKELFHFLTENKDVKWQDRLNLTYDLIESNKMEGIKDWSDKRIESWFQGSMKKIDQRFEEKPVVEPIDEKEKELVKIGKITGKNGFRKALGEFFKKYGTALEIKKMIINKMSYFTNGYPKTLSKQSFENKLDFLNGIIKWFKLDKKPTPTPA